MTSRFITGNNLDIIPTLDNESIDCIITHPPLWQPHDITTEKYAFASHDPAFCKSAYDWRQSLRKVFRLLKPKLKRDGSMWLVLTDSIGRNDTLTLDSYCLLLNLIDDGWICRNTVAWVPTDNYTSLLWHMQKYGSTFTGSLPLFSHTAIPCPEHTNTMYQRLPIELIDLILTTQKPPGMILDPYAGYGTVGIAADKAGFDYIGIEINPELTHAIPRDNRIR